VHLRQQGHADTGEAGIESGASTRGPPAIPQASHDGISGGAAGGSNEVDMKIAGVGHLGGDAKVGNKKLLPPMRGVRSVRRGPQRSAQAGAGAGTEVREPLGQEATPDRPHAEVE
jgi:hypothetical protein